MQDDKRIFNDYNSYAGEIAAIANFLISHNLRLFSIMRRPVI